MLATLGPDAINEQKFSPWSTVLVVLGLLWDTNARTVSMPPDKVAKALSRLRAAVTAARASRHQLEKLLGSLRHVSLCYRSARAFFQRLQALWRVAPRFGSVLISPSVLHDLLWVESLLLHGAMNGIPTSLLAGTSVPDVHLFMDASDSGLAVLYPAIREFFRVQFDSEEAHSLRATTEFSINTRELLSAVLAVLVWGPVWKGVPTVLRRPINVRCWIDNLSATAWVNRHRACTPAGQELLRVLSCAEVEFRLHVSAAHIPGSRNTLADLGSRAWSGECLRDWTNKMSAWCEQAVPPQFRKIYNGTWSSYNGARSLTLPGDTTWLPGSAGVPSARGPASPRWLSPDDPNGQSLQLIIFAISCWHKRTATAPLRFGTIRALLSHIQWCHQLAVGFRPRLQPQHELVLQGMRRLSPPRHHRGAVSVDMLRTIASCADFSSAQHRVICGAAVLGFYFCLRGAEYLSSRGKRHGYCLQVQDIVVADAHGTSTTSFVAATSVSIILRGSKTDQTGHSTKRTLLKNDQAPVCPVFAALLLLRNAITLKLPKDAPLCSVSRNNTLSAETMTTVLRRAAKRCRVDPQHISAHSLRAGGATALHSAGVDTDTIRMHGRWASDAYQAYVHEAPAEQLQLSRRMGSQHHL